MAAATSPTLQAIPLRAIATNLPELLLGALEPLETQANHVDVSLRLEGPESLPPVMIDPEKIAWAVTTLVGNAMRFVKRGNRHMPGGSITVRLAREGDDVLVSVEDDGPGIPDAKVPYLFKRAPGAVHAAGRTVGICGEAPSNYADFAAFLVEHGIDSISLSPDALVRTIRRVAEIEHRLFPEAAQ